MTAEDRELLLEVLSEVRLLRAELSRRRGGPRDQADAALPPAILHAVAHRGFTARELMAHAEVDRELAAAIERTDVTSARELGKLLARLEGQPIAGVALVRVGAERDGIVWRLRLCESDSRIVASGDTQGWR